MRISPKARRLAKEHDVDLNQVRGSGPGGEILADDILAAAEHVRLKAQTTEQVRLKPDTTRGIEIDAPDTTSGASHDDRPTYGRTDDAELDDCSAFLRHERVDAGALKAARDAMLPAVEKSHAVKITFTDLIVRAAAMR